MVGQYSKTKENKTTNNRIKEEQPANSNNRIKEETHNSFGFSCSGVMVDIIDCMNC